jgi:hypothetical protein
MVENGNIKIVISSRQCKKKNINLQCPIFRLKWFVGTKWSTRREFFHLLFAGGDWKLIKRENRSLRKFAIP